MAAEFPEEERAKKRYLNIGFNPDYFFARFPSISKRQMDAGYAAEERAKKKYLKIGFSPNHLSKKAEKEALPVAELRADRISNCTAPQIMPAVSRDMAFKSRISILEKIMNALKSSDVSMIGVHGVAGVGKTTMVKQVAREVKEKRLFDAVVMSTVTQSPDVLKIQGDIADMLGLKFEEESEWGRRADQLRRRLKCEERILVVLDNLSSGVDLKEIGIPSKDEHKGCKILLTSRKLDVLSKQMDCQQNFLLEALKEAEAWELFKNIAGNNFENPALKFVAKMVAMACSGFPVAVVTVAAALRNKSLGKWTRALRDLRKHSPENLQGDQKVVHSCLEWSYKQLKSRELRWTFLLCSLMGQHASIRNLLIYGVGLRLYPKQTTLGEAQESICSWIKQLRESCLISLDDDNLAMDDVVREVAISIASRDYHVVYANNELQLNQFDVTTQLWLQNCGVNKLPESLVWPQLKLLRITSDNQCHPLQYRTFKGMEKLKVLDLTNFSSWSLQPLSLNLLQNLRTLCLDQSMLEDISIIGKLRKLEVLTFVRSNIKHLPREICQLSRLKLLDLSGCSKLEIPQNVISKLSRLEELYMGNSFHQWEHEGGEKAGIFELENLAHLTSLDIDIPDSQLLTEGMFFEKLLRYRISIGDVCNWDGECKLSRSLKLKLDTSDGPLEDRIQMLLKRTEDLYLLEMKDANKVIDMLDREGFPNLKHLRLHSCHELRCIVNEMDGAPSKVLFPVLESMILCNLSSLKRICDGQGSLQPFRNLMHLEVENCIQLGNIFPFYVAQGLSQLQELRIKTCLSMTEVVAGESEESTSIGVVVFIELHSLWLKDLPQLRSFVPNKKASSSPQTQSTPPLAIETALDEIISEDEQRIAEQLFDEKIAFPKLKNLKLHSMRIERLWHGQHSVSSQNLEKLEVEQCGSLKYIFSSAMVKSLARLKHLSVRSCISMEEIIVTEKEEETKAPILFPELEIVILSDLQNLKHFCTGSGIKLHSLSPQDLPQLKSFVSNKKASSLPQTQPTLPLAIETVASNEIISEDEQRIAKQFFDEKIAFPKLKNLKLHSMRIERLWHGQHSFSSQNLEKLEVEHCGSLKYIFSSSMVKSLARLKHLSVRSCMSMEEIIATEQEEETKTPILFPELEIVILSDLQNLKHFCSGSRIECPALQRFYISGCHDFQTFISDFRSTNTKISTEAGEVLALKENQHNAMQPLFDKKVVFPCLREIEIHNMNNFENIWHNQLVKGSFCRDLHKLQVSECHVLKNLFSFSIARDIHQLEKLEIQNCRGVQYIVAKAEDDQSVTHFDFPRLTSVILRGLPKLRNFYPGKHIVASPTLENMEFIPTHWYSNFLPEMVGQVQHDHLGHLNLSDFHGELSPSSCVNLRSLIVGERASDSSAIPSKLLRFMNSLARLYVTNCANLEVIFDLESLSGVVRHARLLLNLKELMLIDLPKLGQICNKNPQGILDIKNLKKLVIHNCSRLKNIFTESMALDLVVLTTIQIGNCDLMEEIISKDTTEGAAVDKNIFPALKVIVLESLSRMTGIYSGTGITSLEEISIDKCPKMKTFISSILREPDPITKGKEMIVGNGDHDISSSSLPNGKVAFPNLKKLRVEWDSSMEHSQIRSEFLCKLEMLELIHFPNDYVNFPSHFLHRFPNLENLALSDASFEEIILYEKRNGTEKHTRVLAHLKALKLSKLPKLVRLSVENSAQPCPVLQNLDTLEVSECCRLQILVPSSVSFQCLKSLTVTRCHGLINLISASAVKHLVQLKEMTIANCDMIKEILLEEPNEEENEVFFDKLEWLHLDCLRNLESFNSGNLTFSFPSLKLVLVKECPKMKCFSRGSIKAPLLKSVQLEGQYYEAHNWEGKLGATAQTMSGDMNAPRDQIIPASLGLASSSTHGPKANSNTESHDLNDVNSETYGNCAALLKRLLVEALNEVARSDGGLSLLSSLKSSQNPSASKYILPEVDSTWKQNFPTIMIAETHISPQVQMSPPEVDKDQVKFASSNEQSGKVPISPATAPEQGSTSDSASPNNTDTSQQLKSEN